MRAHRGDCGWFWTWAAVGAGLVLSFIGIFSVGPFLIPFVTLLLGVAATRRPHVLTILAGSLVALAGVTAGVAVTQWAFLATPLLTLAIGLAPAVPRSVHGMLRTLVIAAIVAGCAVAAISVSPAAGAVLSAWRRSRSRSPGGWTPRSRAPACSWSQPGSPCSRFCARPQGPSRCHGSRGGPDDQLAFERMPIGRNLP